MRSKILFFAAACVFASAAERTASAQTYPSKPVTISVGYAAGGTVDIAARIIGEKLASSLGQRFLIDNKPGASGMIAADQVARAAPDGYTIGMITTSQLGTNPHLFSKIPYKAENFKPIGMAVKAPIALAIAPNLPVKTISEFQAYAKANGSKMTYGSFGLGTNAQLVTEVMKSMLGIDMKHAPYAQGNMARTDLSAGTIDALVDSIAAVSPMNKAGQLRIIGSFYPERIESFPDIPTFRESGFPDLVAYTWLGFVAPAGTPDTVIQKLNAEIKLALADPTVASKLINAGFLPSPSSPDEMAREIKSDYDRWGPVIKQLGISLN